MIAEVHPILHKTLGVAPDVREVFPEDLAVIVVAKDREHRHGKWCQTLAQVFVCAGVAVMGQVTGDGHGLGVGLVRQNVSYRLLQPLLGIGAIQIASVGDQVGVGEMDEFHRGAHFSSFCTSRVMASSAASGLVDLSNTVCR